MEKIIVWVRNLTKDKDMAINLPMEKQSLDEILNSNNEYIIIDCDILDIDEHQSIYALNDFLLECKENGVSLDDLEVLSKIMYFNEVVYTVEDGTYTIVNFDEETSDWNSMYGGNIWNGADKGMCLFDGGYYNPFNFEVTEDIYDWIDWESVWDYANTDGWHTVKVNDTHYLVHR